MTVLLENVLSDADLLRAVAQARVAVETAGTGAGRMQRLSALELEMDRRLAARRLRASAASAGRAVA
ncbi:hypothetical protein GCM10009657_27650 [Oryzihumus leptocrescens]